MATLSPLLSAAKMSPMKIAIQLIAVLALINACAAFVSTSQNGLVSSPKFALSSVLSPVSQKGCARRLCMNGDIEWTSVKVVENTAAAEGSKSIIIQPSSTIADSYVNPGQYVQMKTGDGKPGFYAIANAPGRGKDGSFEFLVKETDSNGWLTNAQPGAQLDMSAALGKGFAIDEHFEGFKYDFPLQHIFMFAAGSGIAPIRAALESDTLKIEGGRTATLYYGARNAAQMAYAEKFDAWQERGVNIVPVLSQPEAGWGGRRGYVQDALKEDLVPAPRNCGVLLCGMKGMVEDVKYVFTTAGAFEGRLLQNF
mmetsp:Transcript_2148/g.3686  ORF Transcript_2148/g.3686 Transcript_2148/m.3686 type:complete len:311 (+) Transcript_2148:15-947(+)